MRVQTPKSKGLPKFNTTGWLSVGIFFSLILVIFSLWSSLSGTGEFFPFQFANILGIILGLGLGIHCVDMIVYHRNNKLAALKNVTRNETRMSQDSD